MRPFFLGFIAALVVLAVGGLAFVGLGLAPVATASAPLPFEKLITGIALNARVSKEAPKSSPMQPSDEVYTAGAASIEPTARFVTGCPDRIRPQLPRVNSPSRPNFSKAKASVTTRLAKLIGRSRMASA